MTDFVLAASFLVKQRNAPLVNLHCAQIAYTSCEDWKNRRDLIVTRIRNCGMQIASEWSLFYKEDFYLHSIHVQALDGTSYSEISTVLPQ